jgi:hypothetical protein
MVPQILHAQKYASITLPKIVEGAKDSTGLSFYRVDMRN